MTRPTSIAKISTPRLFGIVARERLFACLDGNRGRPLIWLDGPPGAGKTTLVASYLEARNLPTLWYQVEPGDADPANLFHYLTLAAESFAQVDSSALPRLVPEHLTDLPGFAQTFFRQLFRHLPGNLVIVLDNYQEAPVDTPLHEVVRAAVASVPPDSSIVCVSRAEPPPSFAQLTANGAVFGLHWEMLRLTLDETREISAARAVREDRLVRALHEQSEGWAAGITLMLERLDHAATDTGTLNNDTRESVFNYFASLLFDRAPEANRQILLAVAFLPHITAPMATLLSGHEEAAQLLDHLYRRHLFTDRRPGTEPIYQFHALFREFLQSRVRESLDAASVRQLQLRSADALEANGDIAIAMELRFGAQDWEKAADSIQKAARGLLNSGRRQTLERWIEALPSQVRTTRPWIVYWLGVAHVQTSPVRGIETLRHALDQFRDTEDLEGQVLCLADLLNAAFLGFSALDSMDARLDELLGRMESNASALSTNAELKVWGVLCSALFWIRPWHPWAARAAHQVEELLARGSDQDGALAAAASALATTAMNGAFDCGDRIARATAHLVQSPSASPSEAAWWLIHAGFLRFFEARYAEALDFMQRACDVAERNGMRTTFVMAIFHRCPIEFRVLGWSTANATLAEMETFPRARYPMADAMLYFLQARRATSEGRRNEAADLAELAGAVTTKIGSLYQEMLFGLIESDLLLDAGRIEKARPKIACSRAIVERVPVFDCWRTALLFIEAWLAFSNNDRACAVDKLRESLSLASENSRKHYLRHFESAMPPLFALALEEGIEVELVQQIIRMFRLKPPAAAPDLWPWPIRIFTLGRFEVLVGDKPLEFSRKVPRKTLALLKALIAYGGKEVTEQSLCDALWSDDEADAARQALAITIVRLRKLLGSNEIVVQQGGKVSLDRTMCWVDAWRFEECAAQAIVLGTVSKTLDRYTGAFLPEDESEAWSVPTRERLRGKFIHLLATNGYALEASGGLVDAMRLYVRGIDADPIVEAFYQGLMRCYRTLGRHTEAISVYRRLRQTLSVVLSVPPSSESQALYREVMKLCSERPDAKEAHGVVTMPPRAAHHPPHPTLSRKGRGA